MAGPASELETILYADVRQEQLVGPRWQLDIAGHYARPDVFELIVHRRPAPMIQERDISDFPGAPAAGRVDAERPSKERVRPAKAGKKAGASKRSRRS